MELIYFQVGSADSIDQDMLYVVDQIPNTIAACKAFCDGGAENRNLIVIRDGVVVDCFKGLPNETNNALLATYALHQQVFPLPINRKLERFAALKLIRASRIVVSLFSRTPYRAMVKAALRSYQTNKRLQALQQLDLATAQLTLDQRKTIAFQLGQCLALIKGEELYTKQSIAAYFPQLEVYLQRKDTADLSALEIHKNQLLLACSGLDIRHQNGVDYFYLAKGYNPENLLYLQSNGQAFDVKKESVYSVHN